MSRLLNYIAKYDENLTITQLREAIKQDEISAKQKETEEIDKAKESFKDMFLKRIRNCNLFGETLQVYHIEEITGHTMCDDFSLSYFVKGSKISFSPRDINFRKLKYGDTYDAFSALELRKMTVISREEFDEYNWIYNDISRRLTDLIKL